MSKFLSRKVKDNHLWIFYTINLPLCASIAIPSSTSMHTGTDDRTRRAYSRSRPTADYPTYDDRSKSHMAREEPAEFVERGFTENMLNILEQMLDVLRRSTIAQECGKDAESKFWATYKNVSNEHDNDFLERANDDMGIILTFAGLFSAVNSTFIIGMQPNPGDTTNALLLQLIQIVADGPAGHDIANLTSSTSYPSSGVWMQALAYASLAFSLLAAFGAVLGKQWLNSYKAARGRGSLEERSIQRQRKLDELERWGLQTVLRAFLVLLQISLLLFGMSLSANMWIQQTTIAILIICAVDFGVLFYGTTILVSVLRPDSPFQTPGSELARAIWKKIHVRLAPTLDTPTPDTSTPDILDKWSAVRWILETSTNPEVVETAAAMVPLTQWPPKLDVSTAYARLCDNFAACNDQPELFVKYSTAMAHLCSQSVIIRPELLQKGHHIWYRWGRHVRSIRDAFMDGSRAWNQLSHTKQESDRHKLRADARMALRKMVVHGLHYRLSLPDDEEIIWQGEPQWSHIDGLVPGCEEFDWLIDYLESSGTTDKPDDETEGDALLALSAMHGLGSSDKKPSYVEVLIRCMGPTRIPRVRYAALRAVSNAREELASDGSHHINATLLDGLSLALFTAVDNQPTDNGKTDAPFHERREHFYFRLIFALAKNKDWCHRLIRDGHVQRCISLVGEILQRSDWGLNFYLAGTFARIFASESGNDLPFNPARPRWHILMRRAWNAMISTKDVMDDGDCIEALPALLIATMQDSTFVISPWQLAPIARDVDSVLIALQRQTTGIDLYDDMHGYEMVQRPMASSPTPE